MYGEVKPRGVFQPLVRFTGSVAEDEAVPKAVERALPMFMMNLNGRVRVVRSERVHVIDFLNTLSPEIKQSVFKQ